MTPKYVYDYFFRHLCLWNQNHREFDKKVIERGIFIPAKVLKEMKMTNFAGKFFDDEIRFKKEFDGMFRVYVEVK